MANTGARKGKRIRRARRRGKLTPITRVRSIKWPSPKSITHWHRRTAEWSDD